jgi:glycosyltransferase involved in cell wall biosynthesis
MRLLLVADGRSPIARSWIAYLLQAGHEVHLVSTFACAPIAGLASLHGASVAFSRASRSAAPGAAPGGAQAMDVRGMIRHWLGPWTLPGAGRQLNSIVADVRPQVVHAMRIPYEGMLCATLPAGIPLLVSVWGNDFTLHAEASPGMRRWTRRCVARVDGLHVDCHRDLGLARAWGFEASRASLIIPTNGGVQTEVFRPTPPQELPQDAALRIRLAQLGARPIVVQPRGFRVYVRNDTFFRSISEILRQVPDAHFLCPGMEGEPQAGKWLRRLEIEPAVSLLPRLTPGEMAAVFQRSWVAVSPTTHDGTPNTLLEAMACGVLPVAGDLDSLREWIEPGRNGLLLDPSDPAALAGAVVEGLRNAELRRRAAALNRQLVLERADYASCMRQAVELYDRLAAAASSAML